VTRRTKHRARPSPGTSPGRYDSAVVREGAAPVVTVVDYDPTFIVTSTDDPRPGAPTRGGCRWIHVQGEPTLPLLEHLREAFDLDRLALEDVVSVEQRPKFNAFDTWRFLTLSLPNPSSDASYDELCVFYCEDVLISFFAGPPAVFDPIRKRLERAQSHMRASNAGYLMYALLDLTIDLYFPFLERFGEEIEALEEQVLDRPRRETLADVHHVRNRLLLARRMVWATREVVSDIMRTLNAEGQSGRELLPFVQDCYEHVVGAVDLIETYRDMATSLVEVYLSVVSNRLNDAMRVLTVIATLFIPPTFIVGIYGMNFDPAAGPLSMPELSSPWGYVGVMGFIGAMMIAMFVLFRRKRWI
jgi:magnesium transporter